MTHIPPSSILLPSGQSNFFDYTQRVYDINTKFPSPSSALVSGIYNTYPKDVDVIVSGLKYDIFQPSGLNNLLSSHSGIYVSGTNLGVFNPYIHYYNNIKIPFVSTYKISLGYDPYPRKI